MTRTTVALPLLLALAGCPGGARVEVAPRRPPPAAPLLGVDLIVFRADPWVAEEGYGDETRGFAMVQDRRELPLVAGHNEVRIPDVSRRVRDTSVSFRSFTDPDGTVVESQKVLSSGQDGFSVLDHHIGAEISVVTPRETVRGTLVAFDYQAIVLDTGEAGAGRLRAISVREGVIAVELHERAEKLTPTPTLVWTLRAARGGSHVVEVTYETDEVFWDADHTLVLDGAGGGRLSTLVGVRNDSGQSFRGVGLRLVQERVEKRRGRDSYYDEYSGGYDGYEPGRRSYEVVPIPDRVNLPSGETTQLALRGGDDALPVRVEHRYEAQPESMINLGADAVRTPELGTTTTSVVSEELVVSNTGAQPLPGGRALVYQGGDDPLLIAEAYAAYAPPGGELRVPMGASKTVSATRKRIKLWQDPGRRILIEGFQVILENKGAEPASVSVVEHLYRWKHWEMKSESADHQLRSPRTIVYTAQIPPGETRKIKYEVEYNDW